MKALREAITNAVMHRDWFMEGAVEMTLPEKPRSKRQRYRITGLGLDALQRAKDTPP